MLLDGQVDTMLMHGLPFERSTGADVDQANNPLADPKRLTKKLLTLPDETISHLDAYSLLLKAHTPVDPRTPLGGSFVAGTSRAAPIFPIPRTEDEKKTLPANLVDHATSGTSHCDAPGQPCCFPPRNIAV